MKSTSHIIILNQGPFIKHVTLFLANFYPPLLPVTLRHTSRDPRKYVTHLGPPIFRRPSTKKLSQKPLLQILSQLFAGVFVRGFLSGGLLSSKVLSGVVFVHSRSVRIYLLHQKITHHFKFHVSYV